MCPGNMRTNSQEPPRKRVRTNENVLKASASRIISPLGAVSDLSTQEDALDHDLTHGPSKGPALLSTTGAKQDNTESPVAGSPTVSLVDTRDKIEARCETLQGSVPGRFDIESSKVKIIETGKSSTDSEENHKEGTEVLTAATILDTSSRKIEDDRLAGPVETARSTTEDSTDVTPVAVTLTNYHVEEGQGLSEDFLEDSLISDPPTSLASTDTSTAPTSVDTSAVSTSAASLVTSTSMGSSTTATILPQSVHAGVQDQTGSTSSGSVRVKRIHMTKWRQQVENFLKTPNIALRNLRDMCRALGLKQAGVARDLVIRITDYVRKTAGDEKPYAVFALHLVHQQILNAVVTGAIPSSIPIATALLEEITTFYDLPAQPGQEDLDEGVPIPVLREDLISVDGYSWDPPLAPIEVTLCECEKNNTACPRITCPFWHEDQLEYSLTRGAMFWKSSIKDGLLQSGMQFNTQDGKLGEPKPWPPRKPASADSCWKEMMKKKRKEACNRYKCTAVHEDQLAYASWPGGAGWGLGQSLPRKNGNLKGKTQPSTVKGRQKLQK